MQGLAEIELWTRRSDKSAASSCLREKSKNPLDLPEIQEVIFKHLSPLRTLLKSDFEIEWKDLLSCRKVCKSWQKTATDFMEISFDTDSRIESYLNLISTNPNFPNPDANPSTKFISRVFEFKDNDINYDGVQFISFMETCGKYIKELHFEDCGLSYYCILLLPTWCPGLIQLHLDLVYEERFSSLVNFSHGTVIIPKIFQSAWEKPFPLLKSLRYSVGNDIRGDDNNDADEVFNDLFYWILAKVPRLKGRLITPLLMDFQTYFKADFGKHIGIFEKLDCLFVTSPMGKKELEVLCKMNLFCLRNLAIGDLNISTSAPHFYRLLEKVSNTLETLGIFFEDKTPHNFDFLNPFPVLNKLAAIALDDIGTFSNPNQHYSLFQKFPNLMLGYFGNMSAKEETPYSFWNGVFPNLANPTDTGKTFTHYNLLILVVDVLIYKASGSIVREIAQSFLRLNSLKVKVEGEVFMDLVHELRYHKIVKLAIDFYVSETGIMTLPAALMGLDLDTCALILDSKEDYKRFENLKVRASLSDWKYLKQLQIQNYGYVNSPTYYSGVEIFSDTEINWIAVWYSLTKMTNLEVLSLINFKIHERLILRMLKNTYVMLHLNGCLIEMCNPQGIPAVSSEDYTKYKPRDRLFGDKLFNGSVFNECMNFNAFEPIFTKD